MEAYTVRELKAIARSLKIERYYWLRKAELIAAIHQASKTRWDAEILDELIDAFQKLSLNDNIRVPEALF